MKKYSVILLFLICTVNLWAQSEFPLVQNFFPQTYKANSKNWDMVQDSAGLIYFANNDGVLIYNGGTWQTIKTLNPVRSLCLAPNNQVLVGCKEDFGVIKPNENGILSFLSYLSLLGNDSFIFN